MVRFLEAPSWIDRRRAVTSLGEFGDVSVAPICRALEDRDERVRLAAARLLAVLGDPRALQPLIAALKRSLSGGSGRRHVVVLHLALVTLIGGVIGASIGSLTLRGTVFGFLLSMVPSTLIFANHWFHRMNRDRFQQTCIEALAALAEKDPVPELRILLPDLQALAANRLQPDEARHALTTATFRIAALTSNTERLPIAAAAPESELGTLPHPAYPRSNDPAALPRATLRRNTSPDER